MGVGGCTALVESFGVVWFFGVVPTFLEEGGKMHTVILCITLQIFQPMMKFWEIQLLKFPC